MAATASTTIDQVTFYVDSVPGLVFDFSAALDRCLLAIISSTRENFSGSHAPDGTPWKGLKHPRPNSKGADKPLRDKGLLMASVAARGKEGNLFSKTGDGIEWGSNLEYAGLHQFGGTVKPKNAKYLSLPLTAEAARAGSPRNFGRPLSYEWARGPKLRGKLVEDVDPFRKKKRGKNQPTPEIVGSGKNTRQGIVHYLLLSEVEVPARPFLGWNDDLEDECSDIISESAAEQILKFQAEERGY